MKDTDDHWQTAPYSTKRKFECTVLSITPGFDGTCDATGEDKNTKWIEQYGRKKKDKDQTPYKGFKTGQKYEDVKSVQAGGDTGNRFECSSTTLPDDAWADQYLCIEGTWPGPPPDWLAKRQCYGRTADDSKIMYERLPGSSLLYL